MLRTRPPATARDSESDNRITHDKLAAADYGDAILKQLIHRAPPSVTRGLRRERRLRWMWFSGTLTAVHAALPFDAMERALAVTVRDVVHY